MRHQKYKAEDKVRFVSKGIIEGLKFTKVMGFNDVFKGQNRYVIEHIHGWLPGNQPKGKLNPSLKLQALRKYAFAMESELSFLKDDTKDQPIKRVQVGKKHSRKGMRNVSRAKATV